MGRNPRESKVIHFRREEENKIVRWERELLETAGYYTYLGTVIRRKRKWDLELSNGFIKANNT